MPPRGGAAGCPLWQVAGRQSLQFQKKGSKSPDMRASAVPRELCRRDGSGRVDQGCKQERGFEVAPGTGLLRTVSLAAHLGELESVHREEVGVGRESSLWEDSWV